MSPYSQTGGRPATVNRVSRAHLAPPGRADRAHRMESAERMQQGRPPQPTRRRCRATGTHRPQGQGHGWPNSEDAVTVACSAESWAGFRGNHLHDYLQRAMGHNPFTETQENVDPIDRRPLRPLSPSSTVLQTAARAEADRSPGHPPPQHFTRHAPPKPGEPLPGGPSAARTQACTARRGRGVRAGAGRGPGHACSRLA